MIQGRQISNFWKDNDLLCVFHFASPRKGEKNPAVGQQTSSFAPVIQTENLDMGYTNLKVFYNNEEILNVYRWRKLSRFMMFVLKDYRHDQTLNFLSLCISATVPLRFLIGTQNPFAYSLNVTQSVSCSRNNGM